MDQQNLIETFFYMLGQFAFDRAKSYVDLLQKTTLSASSPFVCMLSAFAQLAEAEKFYHNHPFLTQSHGSSFLPSRHFLRKERNLKDVYEDVRLELQRIEARPKQSRLQAELDRKLFTPQETSSIMATNNQSSASGFNQDLPKQSSRQSNSSIISSSSIMSSRQLGAGQLPDTTPTAVSPKTPLKRSSLSSTSTNTSTNTNTSTTTTTDSNSADANNHHHHHGMQSPNKFSPFSWFSGGSSKKKNTSNQPFGKNKQTKPGPSAQVNRRLFSDSPSNSGGDIVPNKVAPVQTHRSDYEYPTSASQAIMVTGYTIGRLDEAPASSHTSSRQILSPSISSPLQQLQASNQNVSTPLQVRHSVPSDSSSLILADFSEELMSHFCLQLQYYTQARLELIGIYEKLYEVANKKHIHVDGISIQISIFCRKYQKYFHHPLLAPIKEGMTLECEILMTLIRATIDIQHWRFLTSVFDLQEAQQKLNYWAANTFNKDTTKRRFNVKAQPTPRLYDWLCKIREFLVAKFTIYFHSTLYKNLPTNTIKNTCTKLSIDFYQKLVHFQRKVDALFIGMLFDVTNEKDYRGQGYHLPTSAFDQPKGKNTLQTMLIIPADAKPKLESLQAELFMIVAAQSHTLNEGQFQLFDPSKQLTFFLTKPDSHVILVITVEGQRLDRESIIKMFMSEITSQLSGNRIVKSLNN